MILVIDNYDSFTWNLVQLMSDLGAEVAVRRNDETTLSEISALQPSHIVISPGPGTPADAGISLAVIRAFQGVVPILGVCLGHQAIAAAHGARIVRAARPMHGKISPVAHDGAAIFSGLPTPLEVTRYHSLVVEPASLPPDLETCAWTAASEAVEIQGLRHSRLRLHGVQFHPESVASEGGRPLLANFLDS